MNPDRQMIRVLVVLLAVSLIVATVLSVAQNIAGRRGRLAAATAGLDAPAKRTAIPAGVQHVLRIALLQLDEQTDQEAILDHVDVPLQTGQAFQTSLAFSTGSPPVTGPGTIPRPGFAPAGTRKLPPSFGSLSIDLDVRGTYWGVAQGQHLLEIERASGNRAHAFGGAWSSGSLSWQPGSFAAVAGQPQVHLTGASGLFVFATVLDRQSAASTNGGDRRFWRDSFRAALSAPAIPDRKVIAAAAQQLQQNPDECWTLGPWMNAAFAAYALRDHETAASIAASWREKPDEITAILHAGVPGRIPWAMRVKRAIPGLIVWLGVAPYQDRDGVVKRLVPERFDRDGRSIEFILEMHHWPQLRVFSWTRDEDLLRATAEKLARLSRFSNYRLVAQYIVENDNPSQHPLAESLWRELRREAAGRILPPFPGVASYPWLLLVYGALLPALGALIVLRRPRPTDAVLWLRMPLLFLALILSLTTISGGSIRGWVAIGWFVFLLRWTRRPESGDWGDRVAVLLAGAGCMTDMGLTAVGLVWGRMVFPFLEPLRTIYPAFCWLIVASAFLHELGERRVPLSLRVCIVGTAASAWVILGYELAPSAPGAEYAGWAPLITFVALIFFARARSGWTPAARRLEDFRAKRHKELLGRDRGPPSPT